MCNVCRSVCMTARFFLFVFVNIWAAKYVLLSALWLKLEVSLFCFFFSVAHTRRCPTHWRPCPFTLAFHVKRTEMFLIWRYLRSLFSVLSKLVWTSASLRLSNYCSVDMSFILLQMSTCGHSTQSFILGAKWFAFAFLKHLMHVIRCTLHIDTWRRVLLILAAFMQTNIEYQMLEMLWNCRPLRFVAGSAIFSCGLPNSLVISPRSIIVSIDCWPFLPFAPMTRWL